MKKVVISSHSCSYYEGKRFEGDFKSFITKNEGKVLLELTPLEIKIALDALEKYNANFKGEWGPSSTNNNYVYKATKKNRQIKALMRRIFTVAKKAFFTTVSE